MSPLRCSTLPRLEKLRACNQHVGNFKKHNKDHAQSRLCKLAPIVFCESPIVFQPKPKRRKRNETPNTYEYINNFDCLSYILVYYVYVSTRDVCKHIYSCSPTAESFGVSAQIGSGVVRGGPEARFHQGSTRVPPGFHQGSTRVPTGFQQGSTKFCEGCGVVRALKRAPHAVGDIT